MHPIAFIRIHNPRSCTVMLKLRSKFQKITKIVKWPTSDPKKIAKNLHKYQEIQTTRLIYSSWCDNHSGGPQQRYWLSGLDAVDASVSVDDLKAWRTPRFSPMKLQSKGMNQEYCNSLMKLWVFWIRDEIREGSDTMTRRKMQSWNGVPWRDQSSLHIIPILP